MRYRQDESLGKRLVDSSTSLTWFRISGLRISDFSPAGVRYDATACRWWKNCVRSAIAGLQENRRSSAFRAGWIRWCLLDVLTRLEFAKLVVCHLHHGLRGGEAEADEAFVRGLADRYHCDFEHRRVDVAALAEATGDSIETAGRNARRVFFAEVAAARGISRVFLAHHADDQAETVLMNLLRGAGLNGLAAMREVSKGGPHWQIVRPFLTVTRAEILGHARVHALEWRDDTSNASRSHFRNRLRHDAIPALSAALGRDARPALVRTALLLAEDDAWMNEQADLTRIALEYQDGKLSVTALRQVPTALTRRILRSWMRRQGVPNVGFDEVEKALVLLGATGRPSSLNLPGAWRLRRRAGLLFLDQPRQARQQT